MNMTTSSTSFVTASQLAKVCQVDLKTIHNWCDKGTLTHFRTPGRHIRFKSTDVVAFLRKHRYPIPDELIGSCTPRVVILSPDKTDLTHFQDALGDEFEFELCEDPIVGVAQALGAAAPPAAALVIVPPFPDFVCANLPKRLAANGHDIPCFGYYRSDDSSISMLGGAHFITFHGELKTIGDALRRVLNRD
jgi:excisionase family DNA binding protein